MPKKMLKCPYCNTDLKLSIGYSGADWLTVAGNGSGFGHEISLGCLNDTCAAIFSLVHVKEEYQASVVRPEYRHFAKTNM